MTQNEYKERMSELTLKLAAVYKEMLTTYEEASDVEVDLNECQPSSFEQLIPDSLDSAYYSAFIVADDWKA